MVPDDGLTCFQLNSTTLRTFGLLMFLNIGMMMTCFAQHNEKAKQFIFFSQEREDIRDSMFYNNAGVDGAQITYPWKTLERQKGEYDFSEIEEDLVFLKSKGKKNYLFRFRMLRSTQQ